MAGVVRLPASCRLELTMLAWILPTWGEVLRNRGGVNSTRLQGGIGVECYWRNRGGVGNMRSPTQAPARCAAGGDGPTACVLAVAYSGGLVGSGNGSTVAPYSDGRNTSGGGSPISQQLAQCEPKAQISTNRMKRSRDRFPSSLLIRRFRLARDDLARDRRGLRLRTRRSARSARRRIGTNTRHHALQQSTMTNHGAPP